ncbi:acyl-CoA dehydrogenase family protein [Sphingomonas oryzagri]
MLPRTIYGPEHEDFRRTVRRFFIEECLPHQDKWEAQGHADRAMWNRAAELGLLCMPIPEAYGGPEASPLFTTILMEEQGFTGCNGMNFQANDIVASYLHHYGTQEQKAKYLPRMTTGEIIGCLGMTEPGGGSDLQAIKTKAIKDGGDYIINGSKIFISNGYMADLIALVCKTGDGGARDISIILVETGTPGLTKGKPLKKIGLKAQDTAELFFEDMRVPQSNLLGGVEGRGFGMLMEELAWERLMVAASSIAAAKGALETTLEYTNGRKVFGNPVSSYQNSRFKLAEMKAEIDIGQTYVDRCIEFYQKKELSAESAATAKYWASELLCRVVDECVQLHGGYGYMLEYPIAKFYIDARASRIYVGSNEIMREVIARSL